MQEITARQSGCHPAPSHWVRYHSMYGTCRNIKGHNLCRVPYALRVAISAIAVSMLLAACSGATASAPQFPTRVAGHGSNGLDRQPLPGGEPQFPTRVAGHGSWVAHDSGDFETYINEQFLSSAFPYNTPIMAYDPVTSHLVMLAGVQSPSSGRCAALSLCHINSYKSALHLLSGEWIWDGSTWQAQRVDSLAAYDLHLAPPETFGVATATGSLIFDGNDNALLDLLPSGCIPSINKTIVYYTRLYQTGCFHPPVLGKPLPYWVLRGISWVRIPPGTTESHSVPIIGYSVAYDPSTHQVIMFGGFNNSTSKGYFTSTTWLLNGNSWTKVNPHNHPAPRIDAAMVYDPKTHQLLLYGGWGLSPDQYSVTVGVHVKPPTIVAYHDTWEWTGSNWKRLHPKSHPVEGPVPLGGNGAVELGISALPSVLSAYDTALGAPVVLVSDGTTDQNYLWKWTGSNWLPIATTWMPRLDLRGYHPTSRVPQSPNPEGGYLAAMAYDPVTSQLIVVGTARPGFAVPSSINYQSFRTWIFHLSGSPPSSSTTSVPTTTTGS